MKKIFAIATIALAVSTIVVAKKDKKTVVAEPQQPAPVQLTTSSDSVSYAAGKSCTEGLLPYLQQQLKVDTAYMADFIQGLKDARAKGNDPRFVAYQAGGQIASMCKDRMVAGIGNELKDSPDSLEEDLFYEGFISSLTNDTTKFSQKQAQDYFKNKMEADKKAKDEKLYGPNKKAGAEFLAANAKKDSVVTMPSGLQYKVLVEGNGPKPTAQQEVQVKYEGKLLDGTKFDSSYDRKDPVTKFKANQVIKGWTEALTNMPVGSTWMLYIPYDLAYGERSTGKIPPYSTLIFKVELVGITGVTDKPATTTTTETKDAKATKGAKAAKTVKTVKAAAAKATKK